MNSEKNYSVEGQVNPRLIRRISNPKATILFLGYSEEQTRLIDELVSRNCKVFHTTEKITSTIGYDVVISYGYRHILKKETINSSSAPIINLHISYLPWNRGAHPNFWSFYDATPSGVSIHLIDEGIDTGPIIYQKYVNFNLKEKTFSQTYKRLIQEIEQLFIENIDSIITRNFVAIPQRRNGSYHRASDLPENFNGWDSDIQSEITRLDHWASNESKYA